VTYNRYLVPPRRRDDQLCTWLPLRVHIAGFDRPARSRPRRDLQPLPRPSILRRAWRRLFPADADAATASTSPACACRCAAPAKPQWRAHRRRMGLGPRAGADARQGRKLRTARGRAATRRHGALAALRRKRRAEFCARRAGGIGCVLVRDAFFLPFPMG
jgi:hypothetical protein